MGEVNFLLQRFLVVHVFHLPSYMHYIPAGIVERKKERKKERIKVNFLLTCSFLSLTFSSSCLYCRGGGRRRENQENKLKLIECLSVINVLT